MNYPQWGWGPQAGFPPTNKSLTEQIRELEEWNEFLKRKDEEAKKAEKDKQLKDNQITIGIVPMVMCLIGTGPFVGILTIYAWTKMAQYYTEALHAIILK